MVATIALQSVQEGGLSLDEPIGKRLPRPGRGRCSYSNTGLPAQLRTGVAPRSSPTTGSGGPR